MSKRHSLTGKVFDTSPDDPQSKADAAADAVRKPHDLGHDPGIRSAGIMKISLITVGKIKEKFFQDAIAEYSKL